MDLKTAVFIQQKHDFKSSKSVSSLSIFPLPLLHPLSPSLSLPLFLYLPFSFSPSSAVEEGDLFISNNAETLS